MKFAQAVLGVQTPLLTKGSSLENKMGLEVKGLAGNAPCVCVCQQYQKGCVCIGVWMCVFVHERIRFKPAAPGDFVLGEAT